MNTKFQNSYIRLSRWRSLSGIRSGSAMRVDENIRKRITVATYLTTESLVQVRTAPRSVENQSLLKAENYVAMITTNLDFLKMKRVAY